MKKLLLIKSLLLLCALMVGNVAWGDTSTLTPSSNQIAPFDDHFTVTYGGAGSNTTWGNNNVLRLYAKNTITFTSKNEEKITQITFTGTVNANKSGSYPNSMSTSPGTISPATISQTGVTNFSWTYATGATTVTITIGGTAGNIDLTGLNYVVTYTPSAKASTTTTISTTNLTNTDLKNGTAAGTLTASVTSESTPVANAEITWNSSNNDVATIDENGIVTLVAVGETTITANFTATGNYLASSDTYNLTVTDTRDDSGLSYNETNQTVAIGSILTTPELVNSHNLDVSYESDDESIATVDANGNVTGIAKGSTTITAFFAGNNLYKPGSASYTITVHKPLAANCFFYESFDNNDKTGGNDGTWSGINLTPSPVFDLIGWTYTTAYGASECVRTGKSGSITTPTLGVFGNVTLKFKIESWGTDTANGFVDIVNGGTFDDSESIDGVTLQTVDNAKTRAKVTLKKTGTWTEYSLKLIGVTSATKIKFSDDNNSKRLFIDEIEMLLDKTTATVSAAGYATFACPLAADFSAESELTVYKANLNTDKTYITLTEIESKKVPANTGVILKGATNTYNGTVIASAEALGENDLCVSDGTNAVGDNVYVLGNTNGIGFYKWTSNNSLSAGKVYLNVPAMNAPAGSRDYLTFALEDQATGVGASVMNSEKSKVNSDIFDLQGRRVVNPTKGLYIVNGKKVIVK